jgi:LuxR family maltose regulon positive regulatory protein
VALTLTGHRSEGLERLREGSALARALRVSIVEANALAWEGFLAVVDGDFAKGAPQVARASELVRTHRLDRLATSALSITMIALLHATRGRGPEARLTLGAARRISQQVTQIAPWFSVAGPLVQCRTALLLGDPGLARTLLWQAREHLAPDLADTILASLLADCEGLLEEAGSAGLTASALTPAELRVLQYLPSRLTFPQIGERLFISQNTVKTHAMAIYRKLGATSRDTAVSRARSLGLVESPLLP